jgi:molybdenum cofactor cytidylyltransferase
VTQASDLVDAFGLTPGAVLAIAGAGGKSTLARTLGRQAVARGWRVLLCATTRLGWTPDDGPAWLVDDASPAQPAALLAALRTRARGASLLALHGARDHGTRYRGLPPDWLGRLLAPQSPTLAELLLVECDGARGRTLKWPGAHEPVMPVGCTHWVVCLGLAALGQGLDDDHVHRSALACRALGVAAGTRVDAALLARLLLHPEGYLARWPRAARGMIFVNQVEDAAQWALVEGLAPALLTRWERVLAGSAARGLARAWSRP